MTIGKRFHLRKEESDSGFTLLELLAVIAIIGILAAIALPAIGRIRERARIGAVRAQLQQIQTALDDYYTEWDTYPPMGNDWLGGFFFPSEDVGTDGIGPFAWNDVTKQWEANAAYTGPDSNGTEANYVLDPGEDLGLDLAVNDPYDDSSGIPNNFSNNNGNLTEDSLGENNGRLDGTYYQRMGMFTSEGTAALLDLFAAGDMYYHYYAGQVTGKTATGMPKYRSYIDLTDYMNNAPTYYNRWVLYSVGIDGTDHGLHNYYLTMQDGEDVGEDGYASDPSDEDGDFILFEPNATGENDDSNTPLVPVTIIETGWTTPGGIDEEDAPGGSAGLDGPRGEPVFSYKVRAERRSSRSIYAMPDGNAGAYGVIMRYGP